MLLKTMICIKNKKAYHNFTFLEDFEAGIQLLGTEIKAIRAGKLNFLDAYAFVKKGEIWLSGLHISPYLTASFFNHEPMRERKLLLTKKEIGKLEKKIAEKGLTIVPKKIYINDRGLAKMTVSLAVGKKLHDKRESIKQKDMKRDTERSVKAFK